MRRWIIFFALLGLGFGVYAAFTLNPIKETEPLEIIETVNAQSNGNRPIKQAAVEQNSEKEKFHCAEPEISEIWRTVKKTDFVIGYLNGETETGDCKDYLAITRRVDLNDDGKDELYVEGGYKISPVTFRPSWIFQKTGDGYRLLLEERDDKMKILKEVTNGFHDLYFVTRRTTYTMFLSTYKFKDGKYESVKCLVAIPFGDGQQAKLFNCDNEKGIEAFEKENGQITNKP